MEFRKMVTITLYARQQNRHRYIEQYFGPCGRGRRWDDLGEWHWNMYNIIYETTTTKRAKLAKTSITKHGRECEVPRPPTHSWWKYKSTESWCHHPVNLKEHNLWLGHSTPRYPAYLNVCTWIQGDTDKNAQSWCSHKIPKQVTS